MSKNRKQTISSTEHKIYNSALLGRAIQGKIIDILNKNRDKYNIIQCKKTKPGSLYNSDIYIQQLVIIENGQNIPIDKLIEIKICCTADGNHKNCTTPFKTALGASMAWLSEKAIPHFMFFDLVDGADGTEHQKHIDHLNRHGVQVLVMPHYPRDDEYRLIIDFLMKPYDYRKLIERNQLLQGLYRANMDCNEHI